MDRRTTACGISLLAIMGYFVYKRLHESKETIATQPKKENRDCDPAHKPPKTCALHNHFPHLLNKDDDFREKPLVVHNRFPVDIHDGDEFIPTQVNGPTIQRQL